jgi:putative ABC transport system ATP-binding protein
VTLALRHVSVGFQDGDERVEVLADVMVTFAAGRVTAVTGPSGSGKSTLVAVAGGLLRPDTGQVLVEGTDITALDDRARTRLRRDRIGLVLQTGNLVPALGALDQLLLVAHIQGRRRQAVADRARRLLGRVGMSHRLHHRPGQLSGGECQRVALARALVAEPAVLLVDEPTAAIDRRQATAISELVAETTHEHGCATVVVTHDEAVLDAADDTVPIATLAHRADGTARLPGVAG